MRMSADMHLDAEARIVSNPAVCHGAPVIRGTRIMIDRQKPPIFRIADFNPS
jgi:hypothetical protein